jgi:hypothetical protein
MMETNRKMSSGLEFHLGKRFSVEIQASANGIYQVNWSITNSAEHSVFAVAFDNQGGISRSDFVTVRFNTSPSVAITSPTSNQVLVAGIPIDIQSQASDADGTVASVEYYLNGQRLLGQGSGLNFTLSWIPDCIGSFTLVAKATDNDGSVSCSAPVGIVVASPIPEVALFAPSSNTTVYVGVPLALEAEITIASPGQITRVEFFVNSVLLGAATNEPFWLAWTPPAVGPYTITAQAYSDTGTTATSPATDVTAVLAQPQVNIVSPADSQFLDLSEPALIFARVTDPANAVTNFEFIINGALYTNSMLWFTHWTPSTLGPHVLEVFANDRFGQRIGSPPVTVTVADLQPPTVVLLNPTNGATFDFESIVTWQVRATDPDGVVTNLVLKWDGQTVVQTNLATFDQPWTNAMAGWHWLFASVTDNTGQSGQTSARYFVRRTENPELVAPSALSAEGISSVEIKLSWSPVAINGLPVGVVVERWDPAQSVWIEVGQTATTQTEYSDVGLNPETAYRYRVATVDASGARSAYSPEVQATTRTLVPMYSVIDITESLLASISNQGPLSTVLTNAGLNNYDRRRDGVSWTNHVANTLGTNAATLKLAVARFKERWPQIQLDFDPVLLTPKSILPRSGYLTGPGGGGVTVSEATAQLFDPNDPYRPIKAFLHEHQALFGFGSEGLSEATVQKDYTAGAAAIRTVVCQQHVAGVPVFGALLIGHLTPSNELAAVSSQFIPVPVLAADPAMLNLLQAGSELPCPAPYALVAAVMNVGEVFGVGDMLVKSNAQGQVRQQVFTASTGIKGDAYAELVWFPSSRSQLRLCWQALFTSQWRNEMYLTLVAADTGEVLLRRCLTTTISDAVYRVYAGRSPAPMSPGWSTPNAAQPSFVDRAYITLSALDTNASPNGWINDGVNETWGNNVDAHLDRNDDDYADAPRPTGNPWHVFDFPLDLSGDPGTYRNAAAVQLFYWNNWMHDVLYGFGFTEAAGNFQTENFGRGGLEGDAVQADAQDGADLRDRRHQDNANMSTPPDGYPARMQMYVFTGPDPDRDGSLDAEIILHEYTHGLSGRLVGGGAGFDALATAGLGEGWSDFYPLALLAQPGDDVDGAYPMGAYVTYRGFDTGFEENYYYGIRRYPYCTDTNKNPLTFRDIDPWQASPHAGVPRNPLLGPFRAEMAGEVHHQGEVWGTMLWEVQASLVKKHGFAPGNSLALQLVTDGLKLSPPNPNWVQARDAILLADRILTGGANETEIWSAFAKRGLGYGAKAPESDTTSGVQEGYDLIPVLAVERVEVLGGNGNGSVEPGEDNNLVIHVANHGTGAATQVMVQLSTGTPGVAVLQALSAFPDIPQGQARTNTTLFQIRTDPGFVDGTAIDLVLVISSASASITNGLRLYGGVPGAAVFFDTYSALGGSSTNTTEQRYLTPLWISNLDPLWMNDDNGCLLAASKGNYVYRRVDGALFFMLNKDFLAHRLTRQNSVVGRLKLDDTPVVLVREDVYTNQLNQVQTNRVCFTNWYPHSIGVKWIPGDSGPVPLTSTIVSRSNYPYRFPKASLIYTNVGSAYILTNYWPTNALGFTTQFPTLNDVWDLNTNGQAVGAISVYAKPLDANLDGQIDRIELESSVCEQHQYGPAGVLNWLEVTERGANANYGASADVAVNDNTLLTTAAQFNSDGTWRWLGSVAFTQGGSPVAIGLLVNDIGVIAGYGTVFTGNPAVDAYVPTHAFRCANDAEFAEGSSLLTYGTVPVVQDLRVLPGGLRSFPRAMNRGGELVGYSDFDVVGPGGVVPNPLNFHGVYWSTNATVPEDLGSLGPLPGALRGFSDAYAINHQGQIVGTSRRPADGANAGVLWQRNRNQGGTNAFWQTNDLNCCLVQLPTSRFYVPCAVDINTNGIILAQAQRSVRTTGGRWTQPSSCAVLLLPIDLDVDSDNNDGTNPPRRDETEEVLEDFERSFLTPEQAPGKIIQVDEGDFDGDKIPDFADGMDIYGGYSNNACAPFVPMVIDLRGLLTLTNAKVKFDYPESSPTKVVVTNLPGGSRVWSPGPGVLRIWRRNGNQARHIADIKQNGDFLKANTEYTLNELGVDAQGVTTNYVEAVVPGTSLADQAVTLYVSLDGQKWQQATGVRFTAIRVDLDGDGNHDGVIAGDGDDDVMEDRPSGIVVLCNVDDDDLNSVEDNRGADANQINGADDLNDLAPIVLRQMLTVPTNWIMTLRLHSPTNVATNKNAGDVVRIFSSRRDTNAAVLLGPGKERYDLPRHSTNHVDLETLLAQDLELGVEGLEFAGEVRLKVELKNDVSQVVASDELLLKVAPLIFLHHLLPPTNSYVSELPASAESAIYCTSRFPGALPRGVTSHVIMPPLNGSWDVWAQDQFQIGYQDAPYGHMYVVLNSPRQGGLAKFPETSITKNPPGLLGPGFGHVRIVDGGSTYDSFGNLEVSPPCKVGTNDYRFGRIYYGKDMSNELQEFLRRQQMQSPVILDTSWLLVGHVDEFMSILPDLSGTFGWKVLLASPELGVSLLATKTNLHIPMYEPPYANGLGFDVTSVAQLLDRPLTVRVSGYSGISDYNRGPVLNTINILSNAVSAAFGLSARDFIAVPVLFNHGTVDQNGRSIPGAVAIVPDLANGAVYGSTYIVPDCFLHSTTEEDVNQNGQLDAGETDINGNGMLDTLQDPFHEYLNSHLPAGMRAAYINDWLIYHMAEGEVHCGSNEKRLMPTIHWWQ